VKLRLTWPLVMSALALASTCLPLLARQASVPPAPKSDLDAFMAKVLERRNENWRTLHDYILSEREEFELLGPGDQKLEGLRREFQWFIRDGFLIRSPVKSNNASVAEVERKAYEAHWMQIEQRHEQRRLQRLKEAAAKQVSPDEESDPDQLDDVTPTAGEPRFISEAYFLRFKFEPGNYYLAGREQFEGREVFRIEYLPTRLFDSTENHHRREGGRGAASRPPDKNAQMEKDIDSGLNKVSQVTLWVDPKEYQIVKFTFDNPDFGFLPGRSLVRVDQARASMTMGVFFGNVWLPRSLSFSGTATLAVGAYKVRYARDFFDYRKGEVSAKIRGFVPKDPQR
jgi:hypothetical protein